MIVIVFNGWEVFTVGSWSVSNFIIDYINIPVFGVLIAGFMIVKRPRYLRLNELDFVSNIPTDEEVSYEEPPPKSWFGKVVNYLLT